MSILSAQSIRRLCEADTPMLTPFVGEKTIVNGKSFGLSSAGYDVRIAHDLRLYPRQTSLAHTVEDFYLPDNVSGLVTDKSTYARLFISALNTYIDPGFQGNLTLELVNLSENAIDIKAGDPIVQIIFHWLDEPTDRPYRGKYQHQTKAVHGPRYEQAGSGHE